MSSVGIFLFFVMEFSWPFLSPTERCFNGVLTYWSVNSVLMGHAGGRDFLSDCWDYPWKVQLPAGAGVRKVTRCLFSTVSAGVWTALGIAGVNVGAFWLLWTCLGGLSVVTCSDGRNSQGEWRCSHLPEVLKDGWLEGFMGKDSRVNTFYYAPSFVSNWSRTIDINIQ